MREFWKGMALLIIVTLLLTACMGEEETEEDDEPSIIPVEVGEVTKGDIVIEKAVFGRTAPNSMTPVLLQVPGEIDSLEVENGDTVEEDERLATVFTQQGMQEIYAPSSGKIVNLNVAESDVATNEEPLLMITDMNPVKVNFTVTADMLNHFNKDDENTVIIDDEEYNATIISVSEMPGENGLYPVEATIENENEKVITGLIAELMVQVNKIENAITVPTAAIVEDSEGAYVYIVQDDQVKKVNITIQESQSDESAIEGDVTEGDEVVISGQLLLTDGSNIEVVAESGE